MQIRLPQFGDTFCEMFSVCCRISADDASPHLPSDDLDLTASYKATGGRALVRLVWKRQQHNHLHVDTALREMFGERVPPTNSTLTSIRKLLSEFEGLPADALVRGFFKIPLTSLPPGGGLIFAGSSAIKLKVRKSEIELTGARLAFRNADLDGIRWDLAGDNVFLEAHADHRKLTIGERYLVDAMSNVDMAIDSYILGRSTND